MKGKLTVLMITAFVDMLGLAMVIPLLPFYATKLGASASVVGVLIAAFSIAQLASAPTGTDDAPLPWSDFLSRQLLM